jgi:hypothetical protein
MTNISEIVSGNRHVVMVDGFRLEGIQDRLRTRIIEITFTKKDGSERVMKATLLPQYLPVITEETKKSTKIVNPELVNCWDTEKSAWRSFRVDSIVQIEDMIPNQSRIIYVKKTTVK